MDTGTEGSSRYYVGIVPNFIHLKGVGRPPFFLAARSIPFGTHLVGALAKEAAMPHE